MLNSSLELFSEMLKTFSIDNIREYLDAKLESKPISGSTKFRIEQIETEMKKLQM